VRPLALRDLRERLAAEGREVPPAEAWAEAARHRSQAPWFVAVLAGAGGWIAALLLAVGLTLLVRPGDRGFLVTGLILAAGATAGRAFVRAPFAIQLALAASLAGEAMIAYRVLDDAHGVWPWLVLGAMEAVLVVVFADPVHRFLSTVAAAVFLRWALHEAQLDAWAPAVYGAALLAVWAAPGRTFRPPLTGIRRPLGYGLAVAFAASFVWPILEPLASGHDDDPARLAALADQRNAAAAVAAIVLGVAGARALARLRIPLCSAPGTAFFLGGAGIAALGTRAPGVPGALAIMAIAVEAREPVLFWIGAAAGTGFLSWWYYDLSATLLAKSALLAASGLVLLGARALVLRRRVP
jgi:hypothetical protein